MLSRVARQTIQAQRRNFSNYHAERRSKFYANPAVGAENPTYLKEPGDKLKVFIAFTGLTVGISVILRGLYSMTLGVNKVQK